MSLRSVRPSVCSRCGRSTYSGDRLADDDDDISLVDHDLAQHGAEEPRSTLRHPGSFYVNVPTVERSYALNIELRAEEGAIKTRHEAAHLAGRVDRLQSRLVVNVDCQTVQVVRVVAV